MSFFNHPNISFLMFPQFEITPSFLRHKSVYRTTFRRKKDGESCVIWGSRKDKKMGKRRDVTA